MNMNRYSFIANRTIDAVWANRSSLGVEKSLEVMEEYVNNVLEDTSLGIGRLELTFYCYQRLLTYFPWHQEAKEFTRSYRE